MAYTTLVVSDLKAGDRVGVVAGGRYHRYSVQTVAKVTPSGQVVLANDRRFGKTGSEIGAGYGGCSLVTVDLAEGMIAEEAAKRDRSAKFQGLVNGLEAAARNHRNGYGEYCSDLSAEEAAALKAMIDAVTATV